MIDTINFRVHGCNHQKKGIINKTISNRTNKSIFLVPSHADLYLAIHQIESKVISRVRMFNEQRIFESPESEDIELNNFTSMQNNEYNFSLNKMEIVSADYIKQRNLKTFGKYNVTSSEYDVSFSVNPNTGCIDFQVSIPKYLYGHNLAQFIPQYNSPNFHKYNTKLYEWDFQKELLFDRLLKFTKLFFYDLFLSLNIIDKPDFEYIEINRIDLCYNQYFNSIKDCFYYLGLQKKLTKKRKQYSIKHDPDFDTSIAFNTQNGFYFKIYHKGSEYLNAKYGDFAKHSKLNEEYIDKNFNKILNKYISTNIDPSIFDPIGHDEIKKIRLNPIKKQHYKKTLKNLYTYDTKRKDFYIDESEKKIIFALANEFEKNLPFKTLFLRSEMDKILRYEASLKVKFISYKYNNFLFRRDCNIYKNAKRIYKDVKRGLNNVDKHKYKPLNYQRKLYDTIHKFINSSSSFVLSNNYNLKEHSISSKYDYDKKNDIYNISKFYKDFRKGTLLETKNVFPFSKSLLNLLINNFRQTILDFQVQKIEPYDTLESRVLKYNEQVQLNRNNYYLNYYTLNKNQQKRYNKAKLKYKESAITFDMVFTEKEKIEKGLQKMSYTSLKQIFQLMYNDKLSMNEIRKKLSLSNSQYYRRLKYLKMLGYDDNTLHTDLTFKPRTDFLNYYLKTSKHEYRKSFYFNQKSSYEN